ncbi:hypothetical protein CYLTODRAFT_452063 [Cylindrobasidium torrendii FP15055 ss-10]|uniref:Uncharacterized protein n=1 Tax=Cylindrobasidium torrendii FP15055 ss-10 TaxID=1314674 RepID=A0A0D7BK99_9AGAR|nr:hypothetical protein CYLTODRAFT_452063 [Cylindrobasidium torrendii FP15055 ss-10]
MSVPAIQELRELALQDIIGFTDVSTIAYELLDLSDLSPQVVRAERSVVDTIRMEATLACFPLLATVMDRKHNHHLIPNDHIYHIWNYILSCFIFFGKVTGVADRNRHDDFGPNALLDQVAIAVENLFLSLTENPQFSADIVQRDDSFSNELNTVAYGFWRCCASSSHLYHPHRLLHCAMRIVIMKNSSYQDPNVLWGIMIPEHDAKTSLRAAISLAMDCLSGEYEPTWHNLYPISTAILGFTGLGMKSSEDLINDYIRLASVLVTLLRSLTSRRNTAMVDNSAEAYWTAIYSLRSLVESISQTIVRTGVYGLRKILAHTPLILTLFNIEYHFERKGPCLPGSELKLEALRQLLASVLQNITRCAFWPCIRRAILPHIRAVGKSGIDTLVDPRSYVHITWMVLQRTIEKVNEVDNKLLLRERRSRCANQSKIDWHQGKHALKCGDALYKGSEIQPFRMNLPKVDVPAADRAYIHMRASMDIKSQKDEIQRMLKACYSGTAYETPVYSTLKTPTLVMDYRKAANSGQPEISLKSRQRCIQEFHLEGCPANVDGTILGGVVLIVGPLPLGEETPPYIYFTSLHTLMGTIPG